MASIVLTVNSVNNVALDTTMNMLFDTDNMRGVRDNQNLNTGITVTEAGDTSNQMSSWSFDSGVYDGAVFYWGLTNSGTTRTVSIYSGSTRTNLIAQGSATIANGNAGTVFLTPKNESNVFGSLTVTIGGGGGVDDTDVANTLTITGFVNSTDLQIPGATQFEYLEFDEVKTKYTVTETVSQINALGGGFEVYTGMVVGLVDATSGVAVGTYNMQRADGLGTVVLPQGAIVTRSFYRVNTTFTSATDAATIAIGVATDSATGIVAATAISAGGNVWDAGNHEGVQTGTVANFCAITTDDRNVIYTVGAAEALTAGVMHVYLQYVIMA